LLTATIPPAAELLHKRNDPNDLRLGETVCVAAADYDQAAVVLLGCPQDEGVRRNGGRLGAAAAPTEIRRALYKLSVNQIETVRLFDAGDVRIESTLEETHTQLQELVRHIIADGKRLIVLGGGNDISYPDCAGLAQAMGSANVIALNIDTHFDVRADHPRNSGTPYRQLLEEGIVRPQNLYEIGSHIFANSPTYERYLRAQGAHMLPLEKLREQGVAATVTTLTTQSAKPNHALFWGFDLDVVCAADAPGVSAPNPVGMTAAEFCALAALAGSDARTRIVELTEVNPTYDVDGRTSRLAAIAIHHFLAALQRSSASQHTSTN
jgi:formiminoglutamase